mmetsp:Transcript_32558/g.79925  ORF Transcript_32558/g.79925 Transcript_32558/m.79925 type:complete len:423 (+) Transcript_32558:155-1423(+)
MLRSAALLVLLASCGRVAGFAGAPALRPDRAPLPKHCRAAPKVRLAATASKADKDEISYTVIPSALKEEGGGWTIKGMAPPPKQGTVWARARPKVGEVKKMGSGSFGTIYLGTDLKTGAEVAVKTEIDFGQDSMLKHEGDMLIQLQGCPGISQVYWIGSRELAGQDQNIMVMDLLGPDMEHLLEFLNKRTFTAKTGLMIARQMMDCLDAIHSKGILHRDIKPENFLMGVGKNANKVYLVDFGLADWYVDESGEHLLESKTDPHDMRGTVRYASVNKHKGISESRRDDLQETLYVLVYLMCGPLPWQSSELGTMDGLSDSKSGVSRRNQLELIAQTKEFTSSEDLVARGIGVPEPVQRLVAEFLDYCKGLEYADCPDYDYLRRRIDEVMKDMKYEFDYNYDWGNKAPPSVPSGFFKNLLSGAK